MKYLYITVAFVLLMTSCEKGDDTNILPSSFDYIAFENTNLTTNEDNAELIVTNLIYSSSDLSKDRTFQYTIGAPDGKLAAQQGIDFSLPSGSGTVTLLAGQTKVEVPLLQVINNETSDGPRYVSFTLQEVAGFLGGEPDNRTLTTEIRIDEDDLFTFGYTSFEEVPTFNTLTTYPRPADSVDPLPNIQDLDASSESPYVSFTATGNELGFTASFLAASVSSIENERIGVYNNSVAQDNPDDFETTFIDGNQAYVTSDLDGFLTLTFDEITNLNPDISNPVMDIKLFFRTTSWETEDGIVIYFKTADGLGDPLLSIFDDDVEDLEGSWQEIRVPIPTDKLTTGQLVVTMRNGAGSETIIIDSIAIKGIK